MKKQILVCASTLVVATILVSSQTSLSLRAVASEKVDKTTSVKTKSFKEKPPMMQKHTEMAASSVTSQPMQAIKEEITNISSSFDQKYYLTKSQSTAADTQMNHPALADGGDGYLVKFWENSVYRTLTNYNYTLQMRGSPDDGVSWHTPTIWSLVYPPGYTGYFPQPDTLHLPKYPSLGYWGSNATYSHIFYGTCVSPPEYHRGGEPQLIVIRNFMDDTTWMKIRWTLDEANAHTRNMKYAEIAVDSSQHYENPSTQERPWGFQGLIISDSSAQQHTDVPYLFWQYSESGYGGLAYWPELQGCQSIDAAIAPLSARAYICFSRPSWDHPVVQNAFYVSTSPWNSMTKYSQNWPNLTWLSDSYAHGWESGDSLISYEHPVMAVHDSNLVVLTEYVDKRDTNDVDIVSWVWYDGVPSRLANTVAWLSVTEENERYPEIAWVQDNYYIATYWKDNKLFARKSCSGSFWSNPVQVSQVGDIVPMDYHAADIADKGTKLIYTYNIGLNNTRLRIVDLGLDIFPPSTYPPELPVWWDPDSGATSVDPDSVVLDWYGGDQDGDCITYQIYFGTVNPPPLVATQPMKAIYHPGTLNPNTTYYWKIVSSDDQGTTLRGDANYDGTTDVGDVVYLINYLYKGGPSPKPTLAGDVNIDEVVDVGDVVYLINYLYKNGPSPYYPVWSFRTGTR